MQTAPLILITPSQQRAGVEFADASISLSNRYTQAITDAGGLPLVLPVTATSEQVRACVQRTDGVVLTGGDDVQPHLYDRNMPADLAAKVKDIEPERDELELRLIAEVFRQRKPLLCICRGHQVLNVALGGTLIVDIPTQLPHALNHRQMGRKMEPVHDVEITPDSQLAALTGERKLGVNSTHHQAVDRVASALRVTARSADGVIEAMELNDSALLPFLQSVQFHPERLYDRYPKFAELFQAFIKAAAEAART